LFLKSGSNYNNSSVIKITAPSPKIEYALCKQLSNILSKYDLKNYRIKINVQEESDVAVFSEKEVVKEHRRMVAYLRILDNNYNEIINTKTDAYSTYEVHDNAPLASLSSEEAVTNLLSQNLGDEIITLIVKDTAASVPNNPNKS
jgi:uncharacterized protein YajQ (UPF0234 family)